jgi:nitrate reductase delta subunit
MKRENEFSADGADDYERALQRWLPTPAKPAPAIPPDEDGDDPLFGSGRKKAGAQAEAIERVTRWVRERFKLRAEDAIMVAEVTCTIPGCPPLETSVAFWDEAGTRHHFKMLRPVTEVTADHLPFAWMKSSLVLADGFGCECC